MMNVVTENDDTWSLASSRCNSKNACDDPQRCSTVSTLLLGDEDLPIEQDGLSFGSGYRDFYQDLPAQVVPSQSPARRTSDSERSPLPDLDASSVSSACLGDPPIINRVLQPFISQPDQPKPAVPPFLHLKRKEDNARPTLEPRKRRNQVLTRPKVAICIRPSPVNGQHVDSLQMEKSSKSESHSAWKVEGNTLSLEPSDGGTDFTFDHVFDSEQSTSDIYLTWAKPVIQAVLKGYNGTLIGTATSGRTMVGKMGVVHRAARELLTMRYHDATAELKLQYLQVCRDKTFDLLEVEGTGDPTPIDDVDATSEVLNTIADVEFALTKGNSRRKQLVASLKEHRARCHIVVRLSYVVTHRCGEDQRASVLNVVDMTTLTRTVRREGVAPDKRDIDKSMRDLAVVVNPNRAKCTKKSRRRSMCPVAKMIRPCFDDNRNSCLGLLCCVSSNVERQQATEAVLRFASELQQVRVKPRVNEITGDHDAIVCSLKKELASTKVKIHKLHQAVCASQASTAATTSASNDDSNTSSICVVGGDSNWPKGAMFFDSSSHELQCNDETQTERPPVAEILLETEQVRMEQSLTNEVEQRAIFLSQKLDATDGLVEALFKELQQVQEKSQELGQENAALGDLVQAQYRKNTEEKLGTRRLARQCKLFQVTIGLGLLFHVCGQAELFLATVLFVWIALFAQSR